MEGKLPSGLLHLDAVENNSNESLWFLGRGHFNEFHEAMAHGKGLAAATGLLGFLADYTEMYFTCE